MDTPIYHLEKLVRSKQEGAEDFIGPLDLILHLLQKNKIEIRDIPVAQILEQYLAWISKRQALDLEIASEFIAMASHLLYIKTRMLLSAQDEEAISEMELLIADLERRQKQELGQRIRAGLPILEARYGDASGKLETPPKALTPDDCPRALDAHRPQELLRAMERALARGRGRLPPPMTAFRKIVGREPYSVEQKTKDLSQRLQGEGVLRFSILLREAESRSELVALFLVVLELCKSGTLTFFEEEEELILRATAGAQAKAVEGNAVDTAVCAD